MLDYPEPLSESRVKFLATNYRSVSVLIANLVFFHASLSAPIHGSAKVGWANITTKLTLALAAQAADAFSLWATQLPPPFLPLSLCAIAD